MTATQTADARAQAWRQVGAHLAAHGWNWNGETPRRLSGGFANRNYLITLNGQPHVLRHPPEGDLPPGAHDMAREHRILSRLSKQLPFIPDSLHLCEDRAVLGVPFQILEYRAGLVVRGEDMSELAGRADAPARLSQMMVATLARLHRVNAEEAGLGDLGRPDGFLDRAIAGWAKRGALVARHEAARARIGEIAAWLQGQRFAPRPPTVLHCDFKLDNIILDPETLAPVALVDWDMGTRGDPLFDLATLLSYWVEPNDPPALRALGQMPTRQPGFWTRDQAARHYAELTGCDLTDLPALRVLALFKLGIVFLQLHRQWLDGAVSEAVYEGFEAIGEGILDVAQDATTKL